MDPELLDKSRLLDRLIRERDEYPERSPMFHRFDALIKEINEGDFDHHPKPNRCLYGQTVGK